MFSMELRRLERGSESFGSTLSWSAVVLSKHLEPATWLAHLHINLCMRSKWNGSGAHEHIMHIVCIQ